MSVERIQAFWQKVEQDPALRQKVEELKADGPEAAVAAVVRIAAEAGFAFTAAEYQAALKEELARGRADGELSVDELSAIAGGYTAFATRGGTGLSSGGG